MSEVPVLTGALLAKRSLPAVSQDGDKEDRGQVLILAGSVEVPGAAVLAAEGALRAGAGKLQVGAPAAIAVGLGFALPEARVTALAQTDASLGEGLTAAVGRAAAVVLGPGWLDEAAAARLTAAVLEGIGPTGTLVIDAAALTGLQNAPTSLGPLKGRAVLTPHAGEMASLLGRSKDDILADPMAAATDAARRFGAVVVMKGSTTHIVAPDGQAWRNVGGVAGLGTSGSGDVLAGIIGGLLARGADPATAALWGVFLHASAGEQLASAVGPLGFLAREIPARIPALMAALR